MRSRSSRRDVASRRTERHSDPGARLPSGSGRLYHLRLRAGELPPRVLLPGDPDRARAIALSWDSYEPLADAREYRSFRGRLRGVPLGVVSTGIGGSSASVAVEELIALGVRTMIRVGTSGAIDPLVRAGELVISLAAMRLESVSESFAPIGYPAVADRHVVVALESSARDAGIPAHVGVTATVRTFYADQPRGEPTGAAAGGASGRLDELRRLRISNIEMETATLLTIAAVRGVRAGALCAVLGTDGHGRPVPEPMAPAIHVANEAMLRLARAEADDPEPPAA